MVHMGLMFGSNVPIERVTKLSRMAEDLGFDSVWTPDGAYGWDPFHLASCVAQATKTIQVRMAVINPYDRHPVKNALAAVSTQDIAGGRFGFAVGGGSLETLRSFGHDWVHPARYCREMVTVMRGIWSGENVQFKGSTTTANNCRLWLNPPQYVPVYFGCQRPWMLRLAGEIGDGVLINHGSKEHLPWSVARLHEGAARIGRDLEKDNFEILNLSIGTVTEDRETGREWSKFAIPYVFLNMDEWHMKDLGITREDFREVREPLLVQSQEALKQSESAVKDWMIDHFADSGTPEDCIQHLKGYFNAGVTGVILTVPMTPEGRAETSMKLISEHVLPHFR